MTPEMFELVAPLFHNLATETPPDQDVALFACTWEGCDFRTRYKMLEPIRHSAMTGRPLPRRMREIGPRRGQVTTCYDGEPK